MTTHAHVVEDPRWAAIESRAAADFVYGVRTTGVFCRPSCPSRRPHRHNVVFFADADAARSAGFRACKRCRPDEAPADASAEAVAAACRLIDDRDVPPTLRELAAHVGGSPFHLHRMFKALTGLTPRAYATAKRRQRVRAELPAAPTVTEAVYASGYGSAGRFYAEATEALGMKPAQLRAGGDGVTLQHAVTRCSLGLVLVAVSARGVCAILLGDDPSELTRDLAQRFPRARLEPADARTSAIVANVVALVERPGAGAKLPLDVQGTVFQQRVWAALTRLRAGTTTTYAALASALGMPTGARAVARACAANPLAVAIPCHRVVRQDGALAGYRWGLDRKRELLRREASEPASSSSTKRRK